MTNNDLRKIAVDGLSTILDNTNFDYGTKYEGKVRDCYSRDDNMLLITTDRISCFDVNFSTIPYKGQVLNSLAGHWLKKCEDIIKTHLIDIIDPNAMLTKNCEVVPVEFIVRGGLAGSGWRSYEKTQQICGVQLPSGLSQYSLFEEPIFTPSTKALKGEHDEHMTEQEIVKGGLLSQKDFDRLKEASIEIFKLGQKAVADRGLILADTKYEFGVLNGDFILIDEVHTLDNSRYWEADSYETQIKNGEPPVMLDKQTARRWLNSKGFYGDGELPEIPDDWRVDFALQYFDSYERLMGQKFEPVVGCPTERIIKNISNLG